MSQVLDDDRDERQGHHAEDRQLDVLLHPGHPVAEDVAKLNPDLIVRDKNGEIYTVRYDAVNAMLLNEFLKEHKKVEEQARETREQKNVINQLKVSVAEQEATIAHQQTDFQFKLTEQEKQIEALTSDLQKVSAQLEASKSGPQMVESNQ